MKNSHQVAVCSCQVLPPVGEPAAAAPADPHLPVLTEGIQHHVVESDAVSLSDCNVETYNNDARS